MTSSQLSSVAGVMSDTQGLAVGEWEEEQADDCYIS
jgi:hypothetical protein